MTKKDKKSTEIKEPQEKKGKEEPNEEGKKVDKTKEMQQKIEELTDTLKRVQAEFENYKKRAECESRRFAEYASASLIKKLLPIMDSFEHALNIIKNSKKDNNKGEDFINGVELIYSQLCSTLEEEGLRPIECRGKKFDPYYHEAMLQEESEKEEDTILEEIQKGYMLRDAVIRHSKVKVSKAKKKEEGEEEKEDKEKKEKEQSQEKEKRLKNDNTQKDIQG